MILIILYRMCYKNPPNPPKYNLRGAGAICPGVNRNSRGISGFENPLKGGKGGFVAPQACGDKGTVANESVQGCLDWCD